MNIDLITVQLKIPAQLTNCHFPESHNHLYLLFQVRPKDTSPKFEVLTLKKSDERLYSNLFHSLINQILSDFDYQVLIQKFCLTWPTLFC